MSARWLAALAVAVIVVLGLLLGEALATDDHRPPLGPAIVVTPGPAAPTTPSTPGSSARPPATTSQTTPGSRSGRGTQDHQVPTRSGAQQVPGTAPCAGDEDEPDDDECDPDDD